MILLLACATDGLAPAGDSVVDDAADTADSGIPAGNYTRDATTGSWTVSYVPSPDPIPFNAYYSLNLLIRGGEPIDVLVDATMPEHGHGAPTDPILTQLAADTWVADGMLFQMEGHWRTDVTVDGAVASFDYLCCDR